jgi:16S rRNA (guanine527-N7)-methyltransferase
MAAMDAQPPTSPLPSALDAGSAPMALLAAGSQQLQVPLTATQLAQFALFYQELVTWNDKFNLTAITDSAGVQTKHFLDSLAGLPILAQALQCAPTALPHLHCLDIGTGAGFPGVPLKIAQPHLHWTLMDSTGKKVLFVRDLVSKLGLAEVTLVQGRAEELGRQATLREGFDLVTARAVAPLNVLVEYLLPFVRRTGLAMIYKGASAPQEASEARRALEVLGGELLNLAPVQVPFLEETRFILLVKKVRTTPHPYPRGQGLARKKPIQ